MDNSASRKFIQEFEARSGDTVRLALMARVYGSRAALSAAGLELPLAKKDIWGLLIFAEKSLHFFVHASENYMGFLLRSFAGSEAPKEQWSVFPRERIRSIAVQRRGKGLFSFLFPKPSVLELSFESGEEAAGGGQAYTLYFETIGPAKGDALAKVAETLA